MSKKKINNIDFLKEKIKNFLDIYYCMVYIVFIINVVVFLYFIYYRYNWG